MANELKQKPTTAPVMPAKPRRASSDLEAFQKLTREMQVAKRQQAPKGRLIFALDATASRQPTWDQAAELQHSMFREARNLEMQLVFAKLGPVQWTAPPLPEFHWAHRASFTGTGTVPELGKAWYTGFRDDPPDWEELIKSVVPQLKQVRPHLTKCFEHYALKERVWAALNGHTAMRASHLAKLAGDPALIAATQSEDHCIVLRGKQDISPAEARKILVEALAA